MIETLIGAVLGGAIALLGGYVLFKIERNKRFESYRVGIAAEIANLVNLARAHDFVGDIERFVVMLDEHGTDLEFDLQNTKYFINATGSYFVFYENNSQDLSLLEKHEVAKIISFYSQMYSIFDVLNDGEGAPMDVQNASDLAGHYKHVAFALKGLLAMGDELVKELGGQEISNQIQTHLHAVQLMDERSK